MFKNLRALYSLLCISAVAEMSDNQWMLESQPTYVFLYGVVDITSVSIIFGTPLEELLTSKRTMTVEARGWKLRFAGRKKENGLWRPTMQETYDMRDTVEGLALALSQD